ncbi:flagellar biosynthesis anti-sigma factor FlgM [Neobacillus sp. PS3-34]|uniref:flagellar biosynthesis anti-sigma factor FlgM n=1 Tax=Neobacillus sp. PS3-34 TaxID=3070678 RepID=UPI0027DF32ED|nr:flagellar biosynthesis anti-sigma factor FlgM [Neobacillus sp. PS3-34]WML46884.1 flagellar biosynthesis anti-sigma factor FlgM [Neobacillus sp. PS3-34]
MKINPFGTQGVNPYKRQMNKVDQVSKTAGKATDKVEISATAKEMQEVSQVSQQRQAKIDQLKIQVENGTYKVDPRETAKSMVNFFTKK